MAHAAESLSHATPQHKAVVLLGQPGRKLCEIKAGVWIWSGRGSAAVFHRAAVAVAFPGPSNTTAVCLRTLQRLGRVCTRDGLEDLSGSSDSSATSDPDWEPVESRSWVVGKAGSGWERVQQEAPQEAPLN